MPQFMLKFVECPMRWYQRLPCAARTLLRVRDYLQDIGNKLGPLTESTFCKR
jgi:hypothetical protein